ncbi:hypothetical protein FRC07_004058 [Ceratobasidium sp. 392]|nr:hypothetical protein FRC07_004058 [Ceratobasidium sp. 392]
MTTSPVELTSSVNIAEGGTGERSYMILTRGQAAKRARANSEVSEIAIPEHLTVSLLRRQGTPYHAPTPSTQPSTPSTQPSTPSVTSEIEQMDLTSDNEHLSNASTTETTMLLVPLALDVDRSCLYAMT